jgi:tetratricopeptide (TPR) repeat protein
LGDIAISQGDYSSAQRYLTQAIRIFNEIGDPIGEHRALRNLGVVACYQGAFETAKIYLERALQFFNEIGNPQGKSDALAFLAMMYHYQGDNVTARNYAQNALTAITDVGARSERANALTHLAHALVELGQYEAAADSYRQALTLRYVMAQINLVQEPVAGLARIALAMGDKPEGLRYVKQILHHLESKTLEGTEEPFRVYLTCYQALAANHDDRANGFLEYAHHELRTWAERIKDEALRVAFMNNIPAHRDLVTAWQSTTK